MITLYGDRIVYFDCDDTLIMWNPTKEELDERGVVVMCPGSDYIDENGKVHSSPPFSERLLPHRKHIEQLKKHKARGHKVVVWSAGGALWAEAVCKILKLEQYVDLAICKPSWAYDDVQPNEFIKVQWMKDE